MPSLEQRKRDGTRKAVRSTATSTNFYHSLTASYDSTLSRLTTPVTNQSTTPSPCPFLDLPAELRVQIYQYVLPQKAPVWVQRPFGIIEMPHLLMVSKLVRTEALPIYFALNTFSINLRPKESQSAAQWISKRVEDTGGKPVRNIRFTISGVKWETMPNIMPLLELIWDGTVVLDIPIRHDIRSEAHHDGPFQLTSTGPAGYLQAGLEMAALKARQIGTRGGSMVEVVDAAALVLGNTSSLSHDRTFVRGLHKYNLYAKLAELRAGYYKDGVSYPLPEKPSCRRYKRLCWRSEQEKVKSHRPKEHLLTLPEVYSAEVSRKQCERIFQLLCRGNGKASHDEGGLSTPE